ncbi:MAG: hypothetical protein BGO98_21240 [Myxococcales bacterium 68-20]|nr:MAG: hypothetical protein BGO98_21240 [Myxococcales bacterium 68-20]
MGSASLVRILMARTSRRTRAWLGLAVVLGVVGRLLLVVLASRLADGVSTMAVELGGASAIVFAMLRAVQSFARVGVQRDVYSMTVRAVLAGDVVGVPTSDVRRVALDGSYHAAVLVGELTPVLIADIVTALALLPFLTVTFPARLLVLAAAAVLVVMLAALALRAVAYRLEQRVADAYGGVFDTLLGSIENRVEIVARAGEPEFAAAFERQLAAYESLARRLGFGGSVLRRAPIAAGALAVLAVVSVDGASRSVIEGAVLQQALVLAACIPPIHGALLGAYGMVRSLVFVRPLAELLLGARHTEYRPSGTQVVELPVAVRGVGVGFAYSDDAPPVLADVSFVWSPNVPLVLVGPNGAGKSTLFKLLLGLRSPTSGTLWYGEHALAALDLQSLRRQVAYLPQRPYLGEAHVTVRAALKLAVPHASDEAMRQALERVCLREALCRHGADELAVPVGELSTGQRQRVALARVLLQEAKLMLLDEPDANLDQEGVVLVASIVKELCAEGRMVAIAAHTPELAALSRTPVELGRRSIVALRSASSG